VHRVLQWGLAALLAGLVLGAFGAGLGIATDNPALADAAIACGVACLTTLTLALFTVVSVLVLAAAAGEAS
jgi:hypothetical protein